MEKIIKIPALSGIDTKKYLPEKAGINKKVC